eukprot:CAMPEP_0198198146 /NCGR_PEP_ID=MMETSP1445-20131203/1626_1 /TAXON_ID=36898 /ORGANISM="Pyramimonas sp., Strain CCMP2087" /LENGTH=192 /DNA_ID=CAMNT_0043867617 /DNA_START=209 /DNA_END=787 /DNA_ORIENTATION=+
MTLRKMIPSVSRVSVRRVSQFFGGKTSTLAASRGASRRGGLVVMAGEVVLKFLTEVGGRIASPIEIMRQGASVVLGSGKGQGQADVLFEGAGVSAKHARIDRKGSTVYITDLETKGGTYIEDTRLRAGVAYLLGPGSLVRLGGSEEIGSGTEFTVSFEAAETSAMDEMLLNAFQSKFKGSASEEMKKILDDM